VLENVKKKKKVTRLLERQAIMYGIDCLDETLQLMRLGQRELPGVDHEGLEGTDKRKNIE
jgi:hypothetical protein